MIEINLLPKHKDSHREQQRILWKVGAALLICMLFINMMLEILIKQHTKHCFELENRLRLLQDASEDKNVDAIDEENRLNGLDDEAVTKKGRAQTNFLHKVMQTLMTRKTAMIQLTNLHYAGKKIEVIGYVHSMTELFAWIKEFKLVQTHVRDIQIREIRAIPSLDLLQFHLAVE